MTAEKEGGGVTRTDLLLAFVAAVLLLETFVLLSALSSQQRDEIDFATHVGVRARSPDSPDASTVGSTQPSCVTAEAVRSQVHSAIRRAIRSQPSSDWHSGETRIWTIEIDWEYLTSSCVQELDSGAVLVEISPTSSVSDYLIEPAHPDPQQLIRQVEGSQRSGAWSWAVTPLKAGEIPIVWSIDIAVEEAIAVVPVEGDDASPAIGAFEEDRRLSILETTHEVLPDKASLQARDLLEATLRHLSVTSPDVLITRDNSTIHPIVIDYGSMDGSRYDEPIRIRLSFEVEAADHLGHQWSEFGSTLEPRGGAVSIVQSLSGDAELLLRPEMPGSFAISMVVYGEAQALASDGSFRTVDADDRIFRIDVQVARSPQQAGTDWVLRLGAVAAALTAILAIFVTLSVRTRSLLHLVASRRQPPPSSAGYN